MPAENHPGKNHSRTIFTIVLIVFAAALVFILRGFIEAFLGAVILYVLFRPFMIHLIDKRRWRRGWAASLILVISFAVVLLPLFALTYLLISKLGLLFGDTSMSMQVIYDADERFRELTGISLLSPENIAALQNRAASFITDLLGQSLGMLIDVAIMYFILYYMLVNVGRLSRYIREFIPAEDEKIHEFTSELKSMTFSNALGAPLLALVQGLFAAVGYWIFGIQEPFFWGIMTGFFSFLPVVGSTLIWLPAAIVQYSSGFHWQGTGLLLYGLFVISLVDNVFRMVFQKRIADVHPLITILGVIAGLPLFGVPGIIFGPLLISYFLLLLKIYRAEYMKS